MPRSHLNRPSFAPRCGIPRPRTPLCWGVAHHGPAVPLLALPVPRTVWLPDQSLVLGRSPPGLVTRRLFSGWRSLLWVGLWRHGGWCVAPQPFGRPARSPRPELSASAHKVSLAPNSAWMQSQLVAPAFLALTLAVTSAACFSSFRQSGHLVPHHSSLSICSSCSFLLPG